MIKVLYNHIEGHHKVITILHPIPTMWIFPSHRPISYSMTPAGYPTMQLNSDTTYLELALDPTG